LTSEKGIDEKFLKRVAEKTADALKIKEPEEISIVLVCDARMKKLNKQYRKRDKTTDVLAFDYGEIFICVPQAKRQAKELGYLLKQELGTLLIHGLLHLAGYDHKTKKDFNKMIKKQQEVWRRII